MTFQRGCHRQRLSAHGIIDLVEVGVAALGEGGDGTTDPHRSAEAESAPNRNRRAHPQRADTAKPPKGDHCGMVFVDDPRLRRQVTQTEFGVQGQCHAEHVEAGAEVG